MAFLQVDYKSAALGRKTHLNVFLPVDVDPAADPRGPWPVMVLLHGIFGDSSSWVTSSCVQRYADERKLCVLMPDGENGFYLDHPDYMNNYADWVGRELIEAARVMFPVSSRREDTWIGGLSMGGYGALRTGLKYADTFGGIAAFSSALVLDDIQNRRSGSPLQNDAYNRAMFGDTDHLLGSDLDPLHLALERKASGKPMPRIYLSCGEQDFLLRANRDFEQALTEAGIEHTWRTTPGGHTWEFWEQEIRHVILDWMPELSGAEKTRPEDHRLDF